MFISYETNYYNYSMHGRNISYFNPTLFFLDFKKKKTILQGPKINENEIYENKEIMLCGCFGVSFLLFPSTASNSFLSCFIFLILKKLGI